MWQVFVSIFFILSFAFNLNASELLLECHQLAPSSYQLSWKAPKGSSDTVYHIFAADKWSSLMPIEMAQEFVESPNSLSSLLTTTSDVSVELEIKKPFIRIIADSNGILSDITPLLHFPEEAVVSPDEQGYYIAKKRRIDANRAEMLEKVQPYLIPEDHLAKAKLDKIFSKRGVLASPESMEKAGFSLLCYREGRGLVVARHRLLEGYLIKTYLDGDSHAEWTRWVRRAKGSRFVEACINENKRHSKYIKVPKKWIYQLSSKAIGVSSSAAGPREFVLLVEDMEIEEMETTRHFYQAQLNYHALESLYTIINKSGYSDCHIANVPVSRDQKIAFIDTEFTGKRPVHPEWLTKWFSPKKQKHWNYLIKHNDSSNSRESQNL